MRSASLLQSFLAVSLQLRLLFSLYVAAQRGLADMAPSPGGTEYPCLRAEQEALLRFKQEVNSYNQSWVWDTNTSCCKWQGIKCSSLVSPSGPRVISLSLPHLNITGNIPPSLSSLTFLNTLNLSSNHFTGTIPVHFTSLSHLHILDLSYNQLHGSLSLFSVMPSLQSINISNNEFATELPIFNNLAQLQELDASYNRLYGEIPVDLCNYSPMLRVVHLSSNMLSGSLGNGLGICTQLQELHLEFNRLSGFIPHDIFSITSLSVLYLNSNSFIGTLDASIGNLTNLLHLSLAHNNLSGSSPTTLSQNFKLITLHLSNNFFGGSINVNFANLTQLQELDLGVNYFSGNIPKSLGLCTSLRIANLGVNNFSGSIPLQFNQLKSLLSITLSTNALNGSLEAFRRCDNLRSLVLTKNFFSEPLSTTFDGFQNLQVLALGVLNLKGSIPMWLQNCKRLQVLDMSWNNLEGELPSWLGGFPHLFYLDLSNNTLSGRIPSQLFSLPALTARDNNTAGMQTNIGLFAVQRQTDSPYLTYKKPMAFPPSILLSDNHFSGSLPSSIHHLKMLMALDLSHNFLTGSIPTSLANITSLESLDLSYNQLTGSIPSTLANLTFLSNFNVAHNNLSGPIPIGTQFETFPSSSYEDNPGLCGPPLSSNCTVRHSVALSQPHTRGARDVAILLPVSIIVGMIAVALAITGWMLSGKHAVHHGYGSSRELNDPMSLTETEHASVHFLYNHQKLTVADIVKATNNFDSAHIVGCGGFGLVYRADLEDGTKLAIKKLTGDCGQMEREFRAEVEALSKAQHKNLVPLQGFLQIGRAKLLIYSFMENGSLDYWLHERSDGGAFLSWPMRLKIARAAAAGLAYLHQVCNPHIVHRDIKSSNILLDENFEAHLADFGLARLMISTQTHVTTELVGTLGYIPPEYGEKSNATPRGDVYSFGVVLLELLTGKRPVDVCQPKESADLVAWVQKSKYGSNLCDILDTHLRDKGHQEQMQRVLGIACLCINRDPLKRPSIKDVVSLLNQV